MLSPKIILWNLFFGNIFLCAYIWDTGVLSSLPSFCNLTFTAGREYIKLRGKNLERRIKIQTINFLFKEFNPTQAVPDQTMSSIPHPFPQWVVLQNGTWNGIVVKLLYFCKDNKSSNCDLELDLIPLNIPWLGELLLEQKSGNGVLNALQTNENLEMVQRYYLRDYNKAIS